MMLTPRGRRKSCDQCRSNKLLCRFSSESRVEAEVEAAGGFAADPTVPQLSGTALLQQVLREVQEMRAEMADHRAEMREDQKARRATHTCLERVEEIGRAHV